MVGRSADVLEQPGAKIGARAFCPVSGVAFVVKPASEQRAVNGKTVYFCCPACAGYFDNHSDEIAAARKL